MDNLSNLRIGRLWPKFPEDPRNGAIPNAKKTVPLTLSSRAATIA